MLLGIEGQSTSNKDAAKKYVGEFHDFVNAGYLTQQMFNCDETGLFLKRCLTGLTLLKKQIHARTQPMKDRITILVCAKASSDCKFKPMVIYHSENPRIFKRNKVMKSKLPAMWQSNPKS